MIRDFHGHLCEIRILDPACSSGNFFYVALELLKRLEGEVLNALKQFGDTHLPGFSVDPQQFLGIDVNPRTAAIAELVLWIGFLQWHYRTRDNIEPPFEPVVDADGKRLRRLTPPAAICRPAGWIGARESGSNSPKGETSLPVA